MKAQGVRPAVVPALTAGTLVVGVAIGVGAQAWGVPGKIRGLLLGRPPATGRVEGRAARRVERAEVPFDALVGKRLMVALCFGQSNAANYGDARADARGEVYNFYLGKLYRARDPLLGAGGEGGSVWTRLGDLAIDAGMADAVVLVPIAVSSTKVAEWAPGGHLHTDLIYAIRDLRAHGLSVSHLLWQQGESDTLAGTEAGSYKGRFLAMLRAIRRELPDPPIHLAVASRNLGRDGPEVRRAQRELIASGRAARDGSLPDESGLLAGILPGPDADTLGDPWRNAADKTHFSGPGLTKCAELWLETLQAHRPPAGPDDAPEGRDAGARGGGRP
jgi:hypothetical protein